MVPVAFPNLGVKTRKTGQESQEVNVLELPMETKKQDNFVHLHVHDTYSFQDGIGLPEQYAKKCAELGQPALATTNHGNISNHYKWYKECNKLGIKPILGCELYINPEPGDAENYHHLTALALNNEGYKNLIKIVTEGWKTQGSKPTVGLKFVFENQKGLLITAGCPSGKVCRLISSGKEKEAENLLTMMRSKIDYFYIEIAPWKFKMGNDLIRPLYNFSHLLNIPMIATMDCHYIEKEQSTVQELLLCIQSNDKMDNPKRWKFDQDDFYLKSRSEMEQSFFETAPELDFKAALDNTVKVAEMVNVEFPKSSMMRLSMSETEKNGLIRNLCEKGMKERELFGKKEYEDRLEYELSLITEKRFVDYFLVVQNIVQWAKNDGILVGPARGSSAGSLVCYLLRITEVDPLKFGLIFERFIDINREDLPDIDIDFEDERRSDIKRYMEQKYGSDKVAALATFSSFKGKQIINDLGRVYRIPFDAVTKLKSIVIERSGGDSRASFTIEDTFNQFQIAKDYLKQFPFLEQAKYLEGQMRNMSTHASGILVNNEPLTDFCAIYLQKGEKTTSLDYYDASNLGLLKIDILGLNTLTAIRKALELIERRHQKKIDIYSLSLDDERVFEGFRDPKKLFGVFQFDGQSTNQVCRQMLPETFEELSAINALSRPGPMHGIDTEHNQPITSTYIARKWGKIPKKSVHPLLDSITDETQGVVIYQEQVMKVMREVGKMSWKDTAEIRKLISRSMGVERFNDFKDKFAVGARKNGLTEKEIDSIWSAVCTHGSWSFNKSHSVSYSIISYWTMWLKVYYPVEYYAAMASVMHNDEKIRRIIKEYIREGNELLPIDVNRSKESFNIENAKLRLGFSQVKGISISTAERIVKGQPYQNITDFEKRSGLGKSKVEALSKLGSFSSVGGSSVKVDTLFGIQETQKYPDSIKIEDKIKLCPLAVDFNISSKWNNFIKDYIIFPISKIEEVDPNIENQLIYGIVYDKNLKDKIEEALSRGKPKPFPKNGLSKYCNFILEDDTDFVTVRISAHNFQIFGKIIFEQTNEGDIVLVRGRMGDGIRMFFCNSLINLTTLRKKIEDPATLKEYTPVERAFLVK